MAFDHKGPYDLREQFTRLKFESIDFFFISYTIIVHVIKTSLCSQVINDAKQNLTQWGFVPGVDPFPENETIREGKSYCPLTDIS